MDPKSAQTMSLLTVENARSNHMFMFNKAAKSLHIYNVDLEKIEDDHEAFSFQQLQRDRLITVLPNFDYHPRVKYYLDSETLLYVYKGNFISRNIVTGERQELKFEHKIDDHSYQIYSRDGCKQIYYRSMEGHLVFADLEWGSNNKVLSQPIF